VVPFVSVVTIEFAAAQPPMEDPSALGAAPSSAGGGMFGGGPQAFFGGQAMPETLSTAPTPGMEEPKVRAWHGTQNSRTSSVGRLGHQHGHDGGPEHVVRDSECRQGDAGRMVELAQLVLRMH